MTNLVASSPVALDRTAAAPLPTLGTVLVAYVSVLALVCVGAAALFLSNGQTGFGAAAAALAALHVGAAVSVARGRADAWPKTFVAGALLFIASAFTVTIVGPTWFQALGVSAGWVACLTSLALPHAACRIDAQGRFR